MHISGFDEIPLRRYEHRDMITSVISREVAKHLLGKSSIDSADMMISPPNIYSHNKGEKKARSLTMAI